LRNDLNKANLDPKIKGMLLKSLLPDRLIENPNDKKLETELILTKILNGCAQKGWKAEKLFAAIDIDEGGSLDHDELL
jgi:hypothetical protein